MTTEKSPQLRLKTTTLQQQHAIGDWIGCTSHQTTYMKVCSSPTLEESIQGEQGPVVQSYLMALP